MKNLLIFLTLIIATACGNQFQTTKGLNGETYDLSETLGEGVYSAKVGDLVSIKDPSEMTDEEIIANHIEIMEQMISELKSNSPSNMSNEEKAMKEELIKDLEDRVKALKEDEDLRAKFVAEIRKMHKEIKDHDPLNGPVQSINVEGCNMLKELLEQGSVPAEIKDQEQQRFEKYCQ
ncbi:MAG: hypothetical protein KDD33_05250 [Bdellovibrionales bacterium]|nr:hypothetical protein [Bdellovibrionales bacterium]